MKRILVYTVSYLSLIGSSYAQTCNPVPSCTELGYTTPANEAASKPQCLKCPFDSNYYYCPDLCWEYPLTSCEGSYCKKCDYGNFYRIETPACEYTSTSLPTGCSVADSCEISGTTYYDTVCSECQNGYNDDDGDGICIANTCSGYTSTSSSITGCQTVSSACLSGTTNKYKCDTCYTGYSLSNGSCSKTCTYTATSLPTNCATATGSCQLGSSSGTTTYYSTTCQTCNNGWTVSSGSCVANSCSGYPSSSSSISNCSTTTSCQKGATKVYKCTKCNSGYSVNSSGTCTASCASSYQYTCTGYNQSPSGTACGGKYQSCSCPTGWRWNSAAVYCAAVTNCHENFGNYLRDYRTSSAYTRDECVAITGKNDSYTSTSSCQNGDTTVYVCLYTNAPR